MYNMSKFACVVLCVVAMSLSSVYAESRKGSASYEVWKFYKSNCMMEYEVTEADLIAVVETGDESKVNSCYWGCYFREVGLLNDKGQYDLDNYLNTMKKLVVNEDDFVTLEDFGKQCISVKDEAVNDCKAECERGALLAACYLKLD